MNKRSIQWVLIIAFALFTFTGCATTRTDSAGRRAHTVAWAPELDPEIRSLLKARYEAAFYAYETERKRVAAGLSSREFTLQLADLVAHAEVELAETPEQVIQALEKHLEITKQFELEAQQTIRFGPAVTSYSYEDLTRCWRLAAEIKLLRAKRQFQK